MATSDISYSDKTFVKPEFIWEKGHVDLNALETSTETYVSRYQQLVTHELKNLPGKSIFSEIPPAPVKAEAPKTTPADSRPAVTASRSAVVELKSDVWNGMEPINYHAQIHLGTVPNPFYVDLDTGSSLLWVQSLLTENDTPIDDQTMYQPQKSTTAVNLNKPWSATYGDGATVQVSLYTDSIQAGLLKATGQRFGAAAEGDIKDSFKSKASNGIMGLGFPIATSEKTAKNLVQTLHAEGRVKYSSFSIIGPRNDPKLAAEIDKNAIMQPRGWFVIGSVDPSFYTGQISWCPQVVPERWVVKLEAIRINGVEAFTNQYALIDTGTAYIVASPSTFTKTQSFISGAQPIPEKNNLYFSYPKANLSSVDFVFGGRTLKLHPQDFSLGRLEDPVTTRVCSSIITLDSWPFVGQDNLWIIGGIFLDNVVTIFDFDKRQIGFADISEQDLAKDSFKVAA